MSRPPDLVDLALALHRRKATGLLSITRSGTVTRLALVGGRALWAEVDPPEGDLGAALEAAGLASRAEIDDLSDEDEDEDRLLAAITARRGLPQGALSGLRAEVLRRRIRAALQEGEVGRFEEMEGNLSGIDPALLPDLDLLALGRLPAPALRPGGTPVVPQEDEPDEVLDRQSWSVLDRLYRERHTATWFDLLGLRTGASPSSIRRATEELLPIWRTFIDHPSLDHTDRERAAVMVRAVELVREHLLDEAHLDAYTELLRRGGAPRLSELLQPGADPSRLTEGGGPGLFGWWRRRP